MGNKYRVLEPIEPGESPEKNPQMGMDGGYRGDVSPRQVPLNSTPELSDIRFERTAIRKDFGWTAIGTAAASRVLALIEHKYIDDNLTFHRIVRITRAVGLAVLEAWDGVNWVLVDTSVETIVDQYVSAVSAQGALYIAEGSQILCWTEELLKTPEDDDFPLNNKMTIVGQTISATIDPGDPSSLEYTINFDVTVLSSATQDTTIVLKFLHGAVILGTQVFEIDQFSTFPVILLNREFKVSRQIDLNDLLTIEVQSAIGGGSELELDFLSTGVGLDFEGPKTPATQPAIDNRYKFIYDIEVTSGTVVVGFYIDNGAGFVLQSTQDHTVDSIGEEFTITFDDLVDPAAAFGLNLESGIGNLLEQGVEWTRTKADFEVHGHNSSQGDDPAGVTYETVGAVTSFFVAIDPGPKAKYIVHFARRLIALWDLGDTQSLAFSRDGILNDFDGVGSGQLFLVETHSDAIDNLQGAAVLNSNFLALFRSRSIWRVFETGVVQLAIGAVTWIENLGTNYPFSIRNVRGGVIFLGHDNMVYYLTENGPQAIGLPIHQDLITALTGDLSLVDSGWDPTFGEYYLGIPEGAATNITLTWIFDVDRFLDAQEIVWRKRPINIQRFAAFGVSEVE